jgi:bifunctional non-homologous end joining protein LigD
LSLAIRAGRRIVRVTRPDKPLFPSQITKAELACYYAAVAPTMLPHIAGRPLNLERYPDGIHGPRIIQQRASEHFPSWVRRVTVPSRDGAVAHVVASDAATLVYLADQACITLHPWLCRADRLDRPDRLIFDLDPSGEAHDELRSAACDLGALLRDLGLEPFAMATGSHGYHLVVPLRRHADFPTVRAFARDVARIAAARDPRLTLEQRRDARGDRILVDVMRNTYAHTAVAPYSVRARAQAPVAVPLRWEELKDPATRPDRWTLHTVPTRIASDGDPWEQIHSCLHTLGPPRRRLQELLDELRVA